MGFHAIQTTEHLRQIGAGPIMEMPGQSLPLFVLKSKQPRRQFPDCRFSGSALSQVPRDLGVADQLSGVVFDCGNDDVGPESRPVLAPPPSLVFDAAVPCGRGEQLGGSSALLILRRVEASHRLADDLPPRGSFDQPGALVPRHYLALWIQHKNRVVLNASDE